MLIFDVLIDVFMLSSVNILKVQKSAKFPAKVERFYHSN